jgi:hypothetical protein
MSSKGYRLEQYTLKRPQEVLQVRAIVTGEEDEVVIFRGFSSSLVRPTAADPDVPVLPEDAEIQSIDRLEGPYNPANPTYLQQGLSWDDMLALLSAVGV